MREIVVDSNLELARIRAICFDVDGTLSDTDDVWTEQLARRLRPMSRLLTHRDPTSFARRLILGAESPANLVYTFLDWIGLDDELGRLYGLLAKLGRGTKPRTFRQILGIDMLLPALAQHYPLAVISARDEDTTLGFLDTFNLRRFFRCVATSQTCEHTKPFPDPLLWAAGQMDVAPAACLVVGDTTVDIRMGRTAGAQTVGVLCGFGEERELRRAGADAILAGTWELDKLLGQQRG